MIADVGWERVGGGCFSRKIFVTRWDEVRVAIYTAAGVLIDDPENFTPGGVQVFSPDHGDNSFSLEWDEGYYRVPQPPEEQSLDAPLDTFTLAAKLVPGCRVLMPPPDCGSEYMHPQHNERATVTMRRSGHGKETIMVVVDNPELKPQYESMDLTNLLVGKLKPNWFLEPGEDIPIMGQAAGVFMTRCEKHSEGILFGRESVGTYSELIVPRLAGTLVYRHRPRTGGSRTVGRLCRPDLRWRFSAAVSQSDVWTRHAC